MAFTSPTWRFASLALALATVWFTLGCNPISESSNPLDIVEQPANDEAPLGDDRRAQGSRPITDAAREAVANPQATDLEVASRESDGSVSPPEDANPAAGESAANGSASEPQPLDDNATPPPAAITAAEIPKATVPPPVELPAPDTVFPSLTKLSAGHIASSRVMVDDTMPDLKLSRAMGEPVTLSSIWKDHKLTLVVFWNNRSPLAREQFERLEREIVGPFGPHGVEVVAINVGDPAEQAAEVGQNGNGGVIALHDPDASAFAKVATASLPRTYLLNHEGKILWFDIEYSRGMRRQLNNALLYWLTH